MQWFFLFVCFILNIWIRRTDCWWFSGKVGPELYSQSNSVWADEMYQESGGESHHWTSIQRNGCHVSGTGSQVSSTSHGICTSSQLPMITLAVWILAVDIFQHSSLPLRHFVSQYFIKCHTFDCGIARWQGCLFVCVFASLSRYKLKFSPDKVDTMIVQAICKSFSSRLHPFINFWLKNYKIQKLFLVNWYF